MDFCSFFFSGEKKKEPKKKSLRKNRMYSCLSFFRYDSLGFSYSVTVSGGLPKDAKVAWASSK